MTQFSKRDAAKAAARQAAKETDKLIRDIKGQSDTRGSIEVDPETSTIYFDGQIAPSFDGGIDGPMVRDALSVFKGRRVTLRLNSPGGCVDTGLAVFNALKSHTGGLTIVAELAASMGSLLLQAADKRVMTPSGMLMLHAPWCVAAGDAAEFERRATILRKYGERLIPIYAHRSGKSEHQIRELFMGEHWFNAQEAVSSGFADEVQAPKRYPRAVKARAKMFSAMCRGDEIVAAYGG